MRTDDSSSAPSSGSGPRLSDRALPGTRAALPDYDRSQLSTGIVHIGVGGFHRAHQAAVLDDLQARGEAAHWGITGVGALVGDTRMRDALNDQDGLYTLTLKHPDGRREHRVIGSIRDMVVAPEDPWGAVELMADPATRIVSLTITEGGYNFDQSTGLFDETTPAVAHDLALLREDTVVAVPDPQDGGGLRSVFGLVVDALQKRRQRGIAPFTVMSCDNIQGNGDTAAQQFIAFAELVDLRLAQWIRERVPFPNSMVDRITPVTADADRENVLTDTGRLDAWPVVAEPFFQWVLEDRFVPGPDGAPGRPDFEKAGVQLVEDVEPYELMKLRLLNASHQALCYPGRLAGLEYAHEVCSDPLYVAYLMAYMELEATPTLREVPGVDLEDYRRTLIERFANPEIRDTLARLCAEASDRIPKWLVPVIRENLEAGRPVELCATIVASWARYAQGADEAGRPFEIVDPRRDAVLRAAARQAEDPLAFLRSAELFGDLAQRPAFTEPYLRALRTFRTRGARAALEEVLEITGRPVARDDGAGASRPTS